jgi:ribosome-binding factor A
MQARIARELRMKRTPALEFALDETAERAARLEALIEDVTKDGK